MVSMSHALNVNQIARKSTEKFKNVMLVIMTRRFVFILVFANNVNS